MIVEDRRGREQNEKKGRDRKREVREMERAE